MKIIGICLAAVLALPLLLRAEAPASNDVTISLTNCPEGSYRMTIYRVGFEKNDAYSLYLKMGAPTNLSPRQVLDLKEAASGNPDSQSDVRIGPDRRFTQTFPVRANDVYLVKLSKK